MAKLEKDTLQRVPQSLWRQWSGRQWKTLSEQAKRYGFPLDAEGIDLPLFVQWFHNFLSTNAKKLNAKPRKRVDASPWLEKCREERARLLEIQRHTAEESYLSIEPIRQFHNEIAAIRLRTRERLELHFDGDDRDFVAEQFEDEFANVDRLIGDMFGPEQPEQ
jgi:hypothetical protein